MSIKALEALKKLEKVDYEIKFLGKDKDSKLFFVQAIVQTLEKGDDGKITISKKGNFYYEDKDLSNAQEVALQGAAKLLGLGE